MTFVGPLTTKDSLLENSQGQASVLDLASQISASSDASRTEDPARRARENVSQASTALDESTPTEYAPAESPKKTFMDTVRGDSHIAVLDPTISGSKASAKATPAVATHIEGIGRVSQSAARTSANSKSHMSPSDLVSSKPSPGSASRQSVTSGSDSDSPERCPKKVGFVEPLGSRRSTHTTLEKSNFDAAPRQPSSDAPRYNQSFFSFLSELFENEPPRPNRSELYGPFCHAPSMSEANSSGTTSTTYAHAKATDEAEYKAHTLAWYASLVPDDYDPNDPSKHWMLYPDLRGILEAQDLNYPRAREYLPTIEELRAFRKVYQAILAAGDRISIMEQLGRSSDLIGKAYVTIKIL